MKKIFVVLAAAATAMALAPVAQAANGIDGRAWKGLWRIDPGPRITLTEKFINGNHKLIGLWDCGCRDGKRARVTGRVENIRPNVERARGRWQCPGQPNVWGKFRFFQSGGTDSFRGDYSVRRGRWREVDADLIRRR